jgi:hypothetical protein
VAIDFREKTQAADLVTKLHNTTSHRGAVVLAIVDRNADMQSTFRSGANFVLERPFAPRLLSATLKASYSLMLQERRRYFRFPLQIPVYISTSGSPSELAASSVNISEGGMALATPAPLHVGEKLRIRLHLPGTNCEARMNGEVCWSDTKGRLGIQFVQVSQALNELLRSWLFDRLQESLPERALANSHEHFAMK